MRLTQFADFGLRALLYLACQEDRRATTAQVADAYGISREHLRKVVQRLGQGGFVRLVQGRGGGMELDRPAESISIGKVLRGLDSDAPLVECFDADRDQCVISPACGLKAVLDRAQRAFYAELDPVTLADVLQPRRSARLRSLLGIEPARPSRG